MPRDSITKLDEISTEPVGCGFPRFCRERLAVGKTQKTRNVMLTRRGFGLSKEGWGLKTSTSPLKSLETHVEESVQVKAQPYFIEVKQESAGEELLRKKKTFKETMK
jgi:hypothetical protein